MRCKKIRRLLSAYDDGELSVRQQCRVQEHLHRCPRCQSAYAEMQAAMWLVEQEIQLVEPPLHLAQSVMSALPSPHEMRRRAQWRMGGFAFSFLTTLAVAWGLFSLGLRHQVVPSKIQNSKSRMVVSSTPAPKSKLEEELIQRPKKATVGTTRTTGTAGARTTPKAIPKRPLVVRHIAPKLPRPQIPEPQTRNPEPQTKPEPPLESSPAIVMVSLGSEVEQHPTAEVRTVSSPHVVRRPRLTAELTSTSWDTFPAADGG